MDKSDYSTLIPDEVIMNKIYMIRGCKVMLDRDLADLYEIETKQLKRAVRRNMSRFPDDYQAALCITDHADYDQVGPLKAVFWGDSKESKKHKRGLAGRGLRITKSVFARSFHEYTGIGILDDPEFKELTYCLHDEGHEIIPHGIRSFPGTLRELKKEKLLKILPLLLAPE